MDTDEYKCTTDELRILAYFVVKNALYHRVFSLLSIYMHINRNVVRIPFFFFPLTTHASQVS
jgi:hypothetical protein